MVDEDIKNDEVRNEQIKGVAILKNLPSALPPQQTSDNNDVAIYKSLRADNDIQRKIMRLKGFIFNGSKWVQFRNPVMNEQGISNFIHVLYSIEDMEFSHLDDNERVINSYVNYLYQENYPYFTVYHEDYELDRKDFNLISTELLVFILSTFRKARGAGHRNVVRGTYSEDVLGKALSYQKEQQRGLFGRTLDRVNPMASNRNG